MSAGKILLMVSGVIVLLVSFGLMAGGSTLLWVNAARVDSEGFFVSDTLQIDRDSNAVVMGPIELDEVALDVLSTMGVITSFKFEGTNNNASKQVFMGIADQSGLARYLANVTYDEITDFDLRWRLSFAHVKFANHAGASLPSIPASESIWAVSTIGTGAETLEWKTEAGDNTFVLMNEDGSQGIDVDLIVKAKIPSLVGFGLGLLLPGILLLFAGGLMVFFAARRVTA